MNTPATDTKTPPLAASCSLGTLVGLLADDAERRRAALLAGRQTGPITNFPSLDKLIGGRLEPGIHIIHGSPGVGKSALALGIAAECGVPALFVSAEMGAIEVMRRLIARTTSTYLGRLKSGELSGDAVRELATKTASALPLLSIMDTATGIAPTEHLVAALDSMQQAPGVENAKGDGALVVIDSGHSWASQVWPAIEEYSRLGMALEELKQMGKSRGIPILVIAERSKSSQEKGGQGASAGHRGFAYSAESVFELDPVSEKDADDTSGLKTVKLTVSKNRHGVQGNSVMLKWHGATQKHTEKGDF